MKHSIQRTAKTIFVIAMLITAVSLPHTTRAVFVPFDDSAALFKAKCASCHGEDGKGNTPAGQKLKAQDLGSAKVQKQSDAQLATAIAQGKGKMKPFEKSLSKEQINQLVAHVRSFKK
jgi:cytochrome c553